MKFAFCSIKDGTQQICVLDIESEAVSSLTPITKARWLRPAWSQNGEWIAVAKEVDPLDRAPEYKSRGLYTVRRNDQNLRCLIDDMNVKSPQWSPDGERIIFLSADKHGALGLLTIRPDGSDLSLVLSGGENPTWVTSELIAFTAWEDGKGYGLYVTDIGGNNISRKGNLDWSGDAFSAPSFKVFWNFQRTMFAIPFKIRGGIDLYENRETMARHLRYLPLEHDVTFVAWSPDGERIAWTTDRGGLYSCTVDGRDVQAVTHARAEGPDWSPDGRYILYTGFENDMGLFICDCSKQTLLKLPSGKSCDPVWSPSLDTGSLAAGNA